MLIRAWTDDFISGFPDVDEQHKTLFQMINTIAAEDGKNISNNVLIAFLNDLGAYCGYHSAL